MNYRLEVIEAELNQSQTGKQVVNLFTRHVDEVMMLINNSREVTVTWHRNHGPEFIGSAVKTAFENDVEIVREINGITLFTLLRRMAAVLQDKGTPDLRKTIGTHYALVMKMARSCTSLRQVLDLIRGLGSTQTSIDNN